MFTGVLFIIICSVPVFSAADDISVYVDSERVWFQDQKPFINKENRTLVPVRFVSQYLGAKVGWDGVNNKVNISYKERKIVLSIGQKEAVVDDKTVILDTKAELYNERTMVPLRFVSECLGADVEWNGEKREVYIRSAEFAADLALIDSDLMLETPPPGNNPNNVNLIICVLYKYTTPVEPQFVDLRKILESRFGEMAMPITEYVASKKNTATRLPSKEWNINQKYIRVDDNVGCVTVTVWN